MLSCSYMVEEVRRAMGDGAAWGVRLRYAVETEPLGTGGGVRNAVDLMGEPQPKARRANPKTPRLGCSKKNYDVWIRCSYTLLSNHASPAAKRSPSIAIFSARNSASCATPYVSTGLRTDAISPRTLTLSIPSTARP